MGALGVVASARSHRLIRIVTELEEIVATARAVGAIGLDTEFMREKTYRARLCLTQVAAREEVWLIDPLEVDDLKPIARLLADPDLEVVVHAGRQDLEIFYEMYALCPRRVFDVQLAAAFAGYGASLPYGRLVEATAGVSLVKGESYTDWCRRPLTEAQLTYAADDVRYLVPIAQRLRTELRELGRLRWVEEEMKGFEDEASYRWDPREAWRRVPGRGTLKPRQMAVLREVAAWREETALRRDLPRGWVVKDATLVELARRAPTSARELGQVRGLNAREAERSGRQILSAIARGREQEPIERSSAPSRQVQARARMVSGLADAVVRARAEEAQLATELVATRSELETLLVDVFTDRVDPQRHRLLRGWRKELAGDAVVALAEGKLGVKVAPEPPFIEEVQIDGE